MARWLSRFVTRTPAGIGIGSPVTMELALREVGIARILLAAAAACTRPLGIRELFYRIAGRKVAAIDGPTPYTLPPTISMPVSPLSVRTPCASRFQSD